MRPNIFRKAVTSQRPLTVFLGGQPGAGKTRAQSSVVTLHPSEALVKIIGDDLRQYQDDYWQLVEDAPLAIPDATKKSSASWIAMSVAEANRNGYSIIIEGTWRNASTVLDEAIMVPAADAFGHVTAFDISHEQVVEDFLKQSATVASTSHTIELRFQNAIRSYSPVGLAVFVSCA